MNTYWISFADDNTLFGVVIVDSENEEKALEKCNELNLNPGGQALFFAMNNVEGGMEEVALFGKNRIITKDELDKMNYQKLGDLPIDVQLAVENFKHIDQ